MHCKEQLHGCIAAALSAPDNTPSVLQEHALVKKKKNTTNKMRVGNKVF